MKTYRFATVSAALAVSAWFATPSLHAADTAAVADTPVTADTLWGTPVKGVEFFGVKNLKESKKIVVPTLYIRMMDWGRVTAVTQTSALQSMAGRRDSTVRDTKEIVASVDPELVRGIANDLYADLTQKLRGIGYEVMTHDDVKSHATFAALPLEKPDPKTGVVSDSVNMNKVRFRYMKIAPQGMPVYDPPIQGPLWPMRHALKELGTGAMIITYTFEPLVMESESKRGISSNSAHAKATATLRLASGSAEFVNPKYAGGVIRTKEPRGLNDNVGDIVPVANVSPKTANALSAGLGSLFGGGSISSRKNLLALEANPERLREYMLAGGKAFNDVVVRSLAEQMAAK
jgi:hypothetical protein